MSKFRPHQGPSLSDAISAINHFVEHARNPNVRIRFMNINRQVLLKNTVSAVPVETDFQLVEAAMPEAGEGQVLIRAILLSLDPYMGSAIKARHMSGGVRPGDLMPGEGLGVVVQSRHPGFAEGDIVVSRAGWQTYSVADAPAPGLTGMAAALSPAANRLTPDSRVPLSTYLGVLGMPGLTAYAGTVDLLAPRPGETFVVSAATGPVGATAGQIARNMGARTVGIAGTDEKCAYAVERLGFAACVNYKQPEWWDALATACPDGVDCYFDNVGGSILTGVMRNLAMRARIVLCGAMEQYNSPTILPGPNLGPIVGKRATIKGLVVYDFWERMGQWRRIGADWIADGRLTYREDRGEGLAQAPALFARLMAGQNFGKSLVVLAPELLG
jgi:NADPH-dependent curcumin reductase CurA